MASSFAPSRSLSSEIVRTWVLLPLWWYSTGFLAVARGGKTVMRAVVQNMGLDVWMKNLFVPMYGDDAWSGRIVSFCVRSSVILVQSLGVACVGLLCVVGMIAYLMVLPVTIVAIVVHLAGLFV